MTDRISRITSFFPDLTLYVRFLVILALIFVLFFLWAGVAQTAPVQTNLLRARKPAADLSISVKRHGEEENKTVSMRKRAHPGYQNPAVKGKERRGKDQTLSKNVRARQQGDAVAPGSGKEKKRKIASSGKSADKKEERVSFSKSRSKRHPGELASGKRERTHAPSPDRKRYNTLLALGKNSRTPKHGNEPVQGTRRNIRVHAGSSDDFAPPSADQREAFEKHLLMEEPLDEQTLSIIESAYSYMGIPYQWGGTTPDGFDCSGFVRYVFKENGIPLGRSSREQVQEGKAVPLSELRPGDLVFFKFYNSRNRERNRGRVNHVGLYLGNGRFIHAASNSNDRAITVNELGSGKYFSRIVEVRRILDASED